MQKVIHDELRITNEVVQSLREKMNPTMIVVSEDIEGSTIVIAFGGAVVMLDEKAATELARQLHHSVRKIRNVKPSVRKIRIPKVDTDLTY